MPKSKLDYLNKEQFQKILLSSSSIEDVCSKIGYKQISANLKNRLVILCEKYELDNSILFISKEQLTKICTECKTEKSINEFYSKRNVCKSCVKKNQQEKYKNRTEELNNYKKTLKCKKCGENKYYLLDFHHLNPAEKDYTISDNPNAKMETIMKEIDKCIPLCSNCHREFHYLERESSITIEEYLNGVVE